MFFPPAKVGSLHNIYAQEVIRTTVILNLASMGGISRSSSKFLFKPSLLICQKKKRKKLLPWFTILLLLRNILYRSLYSSSYNRFIFCVIFPLPVNECCWSSGGLETWTSAVRCLLANESTQQIYCFQIYFSFVRIKKSAANCKQEINQPNLNNPTMTMIACGRFLKVL